MTEYIVASDDELDPGDRLTVTLDGREIGIFCLEDGYHAYRNWCPHQGGPVCDGSITGTQDTSFDRETLQTEVHQTRPDQVLNCPWHGWEFDLTSGKCLSRENIQLRSYEVRVTDGKIVVSV